MADVCEVKEREVIDKATSISYPTEKNFAYSKNSMSLLGAGARKKSLLIVEVSRQIATKQDIMVEADSDLKAFSVKKSSYPSMIQRYDNRSMSILWVFM